MNCKDSEKPGAESGQPLPCIPPCLPPCILAMAFMGFSGMVKM